MKTSMRVELEVVAEFVVKNLSNRKVAITSHVIQREMGITSLSIARDILTELHSRKVLFGRRGVYYVNPNQPSVLSSYHSRF